VPTRAGLSNAAADLRLVLGQLMRRLRTGNAVSIPHLAVLSRLDRHGPMTTSDLAAAERMRPQSMAQTVTELKRDGLLAPRPDPVDRRRILLELTEAGRAALLDERRRREDWLSNAMADELTADEQEQLIDAIALLCRDAMI